MKTRNIVQSAAQFLVSALSIRLLTEGSSFRINCIVWAPLKNDITFFGIENHAKQQGQLSRAHFGTFLIQFTAFRLDASVDIKFSVLCILWRNSEVDDQSWKISQ